jgi:renalase
MMEHHDVAIVGAGLAAAAAADALVRDGARVLVLEKARGPGGRCATRRSASASFDHGAQYFTARDAGFETALREGPMAQAAAPWLGRIAAWDAGEFSSPGPLTRRVGVPGMSSLVRALLAEVPQRYLMHVARLQRVGPDWHLLDAAGKPLARAGAVVVTAPPLQAATLLAPWSKRLAQVCAAVTMLPCWAVMAGFERPVAMDFDGVFVNGSALSWCARNSAKPARGDTEAWVLHGSPAWSQAHLVSGAEDVSSALLAAFAAMLEAPLPPVVERLAHRWRYALAATPLDVGCVWDAGKRLGLAGDWLAGSRVEGAWLSGRQMAETLRGASAA